MMLNHFKMKLSFFIVVSLILNITHAFSQAKILDFCTEDMNEAQGQEYAKSKGGPENNKLTKVEYPVRAGKRAFKHWVNNKGERAELAMKRTEIGGTYWYGWSMMLPEDFDFSGSQTIVMQLATWPSPRNGKFPCSANGSYMMVDSEGRLVFLLQRQGENEDAVCEKFIVMNNVSDARGDWIDFVMHAKWTGDPDGFLKFWVKKKNDAKYFQKIDYKGRTFWNDEDKGPYFKMGLYMGDPGWTGPPERTVYTDEYRMGNAACDFDDVDPGAKK